jgi:cellulose synthase/poly-beta-1,6-N-acetylglucosamine synthase-like glycosyltransferase
MLLDVGTKPSEGSLYHFWKTFHENPYAAGLCGDMLADLEYDTDKTFNILMAAQVTQSFFDNSYLIFSKRTLSTK